MPYELWLAIRYLFAKRRERFISIIAVLSISGVAIGVAVLLCALAIISGLQNDLKEKFVGINAEIIVDSPHGVADTEALLQKVEAVPHVQAAAPFITGQAILRLPDRAFGVVVRGFDPVRDPRVTRLSQYVLEGRMPASPGEVMIGTELALTISADPGDRIKLISPADGKTHELLVTGIFRSGMYEYDAALVAVTLPQAQAMFNLQDTVSGLGVRLDAFENAEPVKRELKSRLGYGANVKLWMELNKTLFDALKLEKTGTFILLTLIVLVAASNIISTLVMMVIEKTRDIGVLKSIGATDASVRAIFTWQGLCIGVLGIAIGGAIAGALIWSVDTYHYIKLPGSVYYIDYVPVLVEWADWVKTFVAALLVTLLSTVYPARRAARLHPVEALRYE